MDENEQKQPEDLDEAKATVLPAREAMSIIAPDVASPDLMPDMGAVSGATPDGGDEAQGVASDAEGSASDEESSSSENQSTHASNQDTATSTT